MIMSYDARIEMTRNLKSVRFESTVMALLRKVSIYRLPRYNVVKV